MKEEKASERGAGADGVRSRTEEGQTWVGRNTQLTGEESRLNRLWS